MSLLYCFAGVLAGILIGLLLRIGTPAAGALLHSGTSYPQIMSSEWFFLRDMRLRLWYFQKAIHIIR